MKNKTTLTYDTALTKTEIITYVKALSFPIIVFLANIYAIILFGDFGSRLIAPFSTMMWLAGTATAFKLKGQRKSVIKECLVFIISYIAIIVVVRYLIGKAVTVSTAQLMATYNQAMPTASNSTIAGMLQTSLWIITFMTPMAYLGMVIKKFFTFKNSLSKTKTMDQLRSIRG